MFPQKVILFPYSIQDGGFPPQVKLYFIFEPTEVALGLSVNRN